MPKFENIVMFAAFVVLMIAIAYRRDISQDVTTALTDAGTGLVNLPGPSDMPAVAPAYMSSNYSYPPPLRAMMPQTSVGGNRTADINCGTC
jgi:hypothetical protein